MHTVHKKLARANIGQDLVVIMAVVDDEGNAPLRQMSQSAEQEVAPLTCGQSNTYRVVPDSYLNKNLGQTSMLVEMWKLD